MSAPLVKAREDEELADLIARMHMVCIVYRWSMRRAASKAS